MDLLRPLSARSTPASQDVHSWARRIGALATVVATLAGTPAAWAQQARPTDAATGRRSGDHIVAVVNRELVTNSEVRERLERIEQNAQRSNTPLPPRNELVQMVLDQLIDERAQLSYARDSGMKVDEAELDRAAAVVATQNQLTLPQLRERLRAEGIEYPRFRDNLRDQILLERVREREVQSRTRISDAEIESWLTETRKKAGLSVEYDVAQILIAVPDGATPAEQAQRRAKAVTVLQRLKAGEPFEALVQELSDGAKTNGGRLGLRPASRLPDPFVEAVSPLRAGEVAPQVVRSGAGFHVLKLVDRRDAALTTVQNHARHILVRPSPQLSAEVIANRMAGYKRDVLAGRARFEDLARRHSEDGSASGGGDLGWAGPGQFVPEFEQALNQLEPGQISDPVVTRFGVHLIQLIERREVRLDARAQREAARTALREQKYEEVYNEWAREVRARAYVELREPPQ